LQYGSCLNILSDIIRDVIDEHVYVYRCEDKLTKLNNRHEAATPRRFPMI